MPFNLSKITKGREKRPFKGLVYAFEGVGKTQFAAGAPGALFLDSDRGSHKYDVMRIVPDSWEESKDILSAIESNSVKCESIVIDSATALESMSHKSFFGNQSIAEFDKGYGRGDEHALMHWREFVSQLERIWRGGKNVVIVAHAKVKGFEDPMGPNYDRYIVSLRPLIAGSIMQWSDYVLFAREEVTPATKDKAVTSGVRWLHTKGCPAFDAKARGILGLPDRIPLSWASLAEAIASDEIRAANMVNEIDAILAEIGDTDLTRVVQAWNKSNPEQLVETRNKMQARLEEKRKLITEQK